MAYIHEFLTMTAEVSGKFEKNLSHIVDDCKYTCVDDYLLQHGKDGKGGRLSDDALLFIQTLDLAQYKLHECYYNAYTVALYGKSLGVKYIEGMATTGLLAASHAWNEIDGIIVDLTYGKIQEVVPKSGVAYMRRTDRVIGTIPKGFGYIGVEIPLEAVEECIFQHNAHSPVIDDWCHKWPWLAAH